MRKVVLFVSLCLALVLSEAMFSGDAHAQAIQKRFTNNANLVDAGGYFESGGFQGQVFQCLDQSPTAAVSSIEWRKKYSARFVFCMRKMLKEATVYFLAGDGQGKKGLIEHLRPALAAVVLFAAILFGIKVTGGMLKNPRAEAVNFFIKVAIVIGLFEGSVFLLTFWFDLADAILNLVTMGAQQAIDNPASATYGGLSYCTAQGNAAASTGIAPWIKIWDRFDCFFERLLGFGDFKITTGLTAVIGAALFSGTLGVYLFFAAFAAFVAMLMFLFKTIATVLFAYGGLAMLSLLLPLYAPFLLFEKFERWITEKWVGIAAANVILPAFSVAFLFFALTAIDTMLFVGSSTYSAYTYKKVMDPVTGNCVIDPNTGKCKMVHGYDTVTFLDDNKKPVIMPVLPPEFTEYKQTIQPIFKPLGVDTSASEAVQEAQMQNLILEDQPLVNIKLSSDISFNSYFETYCGFFGKKKASEEAIDDEYLATQAEQEQYTNALKARNEILAGYPNAAGGVLGVFAARTAMCLYGTAKGAMNEIGKQVDKISSELFPFVADKLNLNWQGSSSGPVAPGTAASPGNMHNTRMMELATSFLAVLLMTGAFYSFSSQLPAATSRVVGVRAAKVALASPKIGGATLRQRFDTAVLRANQAARSKASRRGLLTGGGLSSVGGVARGGLAGAGGFVGGFFETDRREYQKWGSGKTDYDDISGGYYGSKYSARKASSAEAPRSRELQDMEEELKDLETQDENDRKEEEERKKEDKKKEEERKRKEQEDRKRKEEEERKKREQEREEEPDREERKEPVLEPSGGADSDRGEGETGGSRGSSGDRGGDSSDDDAAPSGSGDTPPDGGGGGGGGGGGSPRRTRPTGGAARDTEDRLELKELEKAPVLAGMGAAATAMRRERPLSTFADSGGDTSGRRDRPGGDSTPDMDRSGPSDIPPPSDGGGFTSGGGGSRGGSSGSGGGSGDGSNVREPAPVVASSDESAPVAHRNEGSQDSIERAEAGEAPPHKMIKTETVLKAAESGELEESILSKIASALHHLGNAVDLLEFIPVANDVASAVIHAAATVVDVGGAVSEGRSRSEIAGRVVKGARESAIGLAPGMEWVVTAARVHSAMKGSGRAPETVNKNLTERAPVKTETPSDREGAGGTDGMRRERIVQEPAPVAPPVDPSDRREMWAKNMTDKNPESSGKPAKEAQYAPVESKDD